MNFQEFKAKYQHTEVEEFPNTVPSEVKVSVCVQTYQHATYIKECLDSILMQQTDFDFEILLGEDASTDGTRDICIAYAKKYPNKIRLFLHHRENNIRIDGKPTGRFNLLYNLYSAKGQYIALCEGDDYWTHPLKLQKQVDYLESHPEVNVIAHRVKTLYPDGRLVKPKRLQLTNKIFPSSYFLYKNIVPTLSVLYRAENRLTHLPAYISKAPMGDLPLHYYMSDSKKVVKFKQYMGVRRVHAGGVWSQLNQIKVIEKGIQARRIISPYILHHERFYLKAGFNRLYMKKAIIKKLNNKDYQKSLDQVDFDHTKFTLQMKFIKWLIKYLTNRKVLKLLNLSL